MNQPTPDQLKVFNTLKQAVRTAVESVPRIYIDNEPENAWNDIASRMIVELTKADMIQQSQPAGPRPRGPKQCEAVMPTAGQCILNVGHKGQHQLNTGNRWG